MVQLSRQEEPKMSAKKPDFLFYIYNNRGINAL